MVDAIIGSTLAKKTKNRIHPAAAIPIDTHRNFKMTTLIIENLWPYITHGECFLDLKLLSVFMNLLVGEYCTVIFPTSFKQ